MSEYVSHTNVGEVQSLWRYPVKSMMGESLKLAHVSLRGVQGDRVYALLDGSEGKIVTAKNPHKWIKLFSFHAHVHNDQDASATQPILRITFPDGRQVVSDHEDLNHMLSQALGREVTLVTSGTTGQPHDSSPSSVSNAQSEEYWPDIEGRKNRDVVTTFTLHPGTFFDSAVFHLLTTATLDRLRQVYPDGNFHAGRFRPNLVVHTEESQKGFVENDWIGRTLAIGKHVRIRIVEACGRCVMTTLAQEHLPKDPGILRTAVAHNHGNVGVYATVLQGGVIHCGDHIQLEA